MITGIVVAVALTAFGAALILRVAEDERAPDDKAAAKTTDDHT